MADALSRRLEQRARPPLAGGGVETTAPEGLGDVFDRARKRNAEARARAATQPPGLAERSTSLGTAALERLQGVDVPPGTSARTEVARTNAVMAGATGGALLGSKVPVAPGPAGIVVNPIAGSIIGGAAGAAAGVFAPEFTMETMEQFGLLPPGTAAQLGRPIEERQRMARGEAALDVILGTAMMLPRLAVGRPIARATTGPKKAGPTGVQGEELAYRAKQELGIDLMPWQVGGRGFARAALAVAGRFPLIGAPARKAPTLGSGLRKTTGQQTSERQVIENLEGMSAKSGGKVRPAYDLADAIMADAKDLHSRYRDYFDKRYNAVWSLAEEAGVGARVQNGRSAAIGIIGEIRNRAAREAGQPSVMASRQELIADIDRIVLQRDPVQSLRSLDTMIDEVEGAFMRHEPQQDRYVLKQLNALRAALIKDMTESIVPLPNVGPRATGGLPGEFFGYEHVGPAGPMHGPQPAGPAGAIPGGPPRLPGQTIIPPDPRSPAGGARAAAGGPEGMVGAPTGRPGEFRAMTAQDIANELRTIDEEFSAVMSGIFETSTAKKFARVERRGLRGMTWDPVTQTSLGKLAKITLDLEDPKAVRDLFQLVRPQTQRDMVASILEEGLAGAQVKTQEGFGTSGIKFDADHYLDFFGFSSGKQARQDTLAAMFKESGVPLDMDTFKLLGQVLDTVSLTSLPSASTFLARRAQIGGGKAVISGALGGLAGAAPAAGGAAAGAATAGLKGAVLGMAISFIGVRGFVRAISNPAGAQALKHVLHSEASLGTIRANTLRIVRGGINSYAEMARDEIGDVRAVEDVLEHGREFEGALNEELQAIERLSKRR